MAARVETIGKVQVVGTAETQIRETERDARLDCFERIAGLSPGSFVQTVRRAAVARCEVEDCPLKARCQDEEDRSEPDGNGDLGSDEEYATRNITATLTCEKSDRRGACAVVISEAADRVQDFFDAVADFDGEAETGTGSTLDPAVTGVLDDFCDRFDLAPPN